MEGPPARCRPVGLTVRPIGLVQPGGASSFLCRFPTAFQDASSPLIKVGLIQGPRFIGPGYISRGRPPRAPTNLDQKEKSSETLIHILGSVRGVVDCGGYDPRYPHGHRWAGLLRMVQPKEAFEVLE